MTGPGVMPRVLLAFPLADPQAEAELERRVEVVRPAGATPAEFDQLLADADGVILRPPARINAAAIAGAPRLKVIANIGSGVDHIDVDSAAARDIALISGAGANATAVAEYCLATMIMAHRHLVRASGELVAGQLNWPTRVGSLRGHQVSGTTLGIVGFGHTGQAFARMAATGLGVRVLIYDPFLQQPPTGSGEIFSSLADLLSQSMTVSVHVPLTVQTRNLIGVNELALIRPDGVLINAARGGVVDEQAVLNALRSNRLAGAVWDVFADEPPNAARIAELATVPGLIITPHIAGISHQAGSVLSWACVNGVLEVLAP